MNVKLDNYTERKDHYFKMVLWRVFNATIFPLLPSCLRNLALRICGAKIGKSLVYRSVRVYAPWKLEIGDWSCIGPRVELYCKDRISIGDNSVISQGSYLCTASHDVNSCDMALVTKPINIRDGVWIAAKVIGTSEHPTICGRPSQDLRFTYKRKGFRFSAFRDGASGNVKRLRGPQMVGWSDAPMVR